jgi:hypothetical protein
MRLGRFTRMTVAFLALSALPRTVIAQGGFVVVTIQNQHASTVSLDLPHDHAGPIGLSLLLSALPPDHVVVIRSPGGDKPLAVLAAYGPARGPQWYDAILPADSDEAGHVTIEVGLENGKLVPSEERVSVQILDMRLAGLGPIH